MRKIIVGLGKYSYSIRIGHGILQKTGPLISRMRLGKDAVIITNAEINRLYGHTLRNSLKKSGISAHTEIVADSEASKSHKTFFGVINNIARIDKGKKPFILALGGGVVGDLAGFVAAVYRRGVPFVQIPTTLLAQVDSSIGGKVAIDTPLAKNLIGVFYQPRVVIADIAILRTLPKQEIACGLSEIIKYAIISSRSFFDFLDRNILPLKKLERHKLEYVIKKCCEIKARVVGRDEKDVKGVRAILNYGHTIGHAVEAAGGYRKKYSHGEAVAIGMIAAANLSNERGMLSGQELARIEELITKAGLPTRVKGLQFSKIWESQLHDKKFAGGINTFVLPTKIGEVIIAKNVPKNLVRAAIRGVMA